MQTTTPFRTIACLSHGSIVFNPILKFNIWYRNSVISPKSPILSGLLAVSHGMRAQTAIVYAKKKKRRTGFQRSTKLILELVSVVASNLKILPSPLDLVIEEFSGGDGNGGGVGLWRGFGGGGFDGWRRRRKKQPLLMGFLIICGIALLFLTELEINAVCGVLGLGLFSLALIELLQKRGITKDFVSGFCLFGILVALGLRRCEVQKWIGKLRIRSPKLKIVRRKIKGKKVF